MAEQARGSEKVQSKEQRNYMDREVATFLISEFQRQNPTTTLTEEQKNALISSIEATTVHDSKVFYQEVPGMYAARQVIHDVARDVYIFPRRILRNAKADTPTEGIVRNMQEWLYKKTGVNSSSISARHLRRQEEIKNMMLERAKNPDKLSQLSLLVKYEQIDNNSGSDNIDILDIKREILVLPYATKAELEIITEYQSREGTVEHSYGKGRNERSSIMSYADYLASLRK